ncbi:MAG TPA: ABC transporter substrate-binding protein [Acetobacteraceae bacterium]|nr:ABC transporter substrate-binding protein [Acetobacteraceae bacterium]
MAEPTGTPITLQESLRAVFYAPFYLALARGAYVREGVEVRFVSAPSPGRAALGVLDGSADVCWGGPMRVMQAYAQAPDCDLVHFAEVVTRDPFLLLGRTPRPGFCPRDLLGLRVGTVSEVPTPWMCLQEDLRRAGIAPARLDRVSDRGMADNVAALRRGELDVVQVFEPFAAMLEAEGAGHVWYAAADRGPTSYTTLYLRRATLRERRTELHRMVRAIHRALKFVARADPAAIADAIAGFFPDIAPALLTAACRRYQALGIWGRTPVLRRAGYDRLLSSLVSGGFVPAGTPFEVAVDNSLAEQVLAEDPLPLDGR